MTKGYTKLFSDIVTSTIWQEPNDCRVLWITMLALKDEANICRATVPALAKMCNITNEQCEEYLTKFQEPDRYSRSVEFEGRRIEEVEGGYFILNGQKYRDMLRGQERRDYIREKVAAHRERCKQSVNKSKHGNQCKPISEAKAEAEAKEVKEVADESAFSLSDPKSIEKQKSKGTIQELKLYAVEINLPESDGEFMFDHWTSNGWKNGPSSVKDWKAGFRKWKSQGWLPSQKKPFMAGLQRPQGQTYNGKTL